MHAYGPSDQPCACPTAHPRKRLPWLLHGSSCRASCRPRSGTAGMAAGTLRFSHRLKFRLPPRREAPFGEWRKQPGAPGGCRWGGSRDVQRLCNSPRVGGSRPSLPSVGGGGPQGCLRHCSRNICGCSPGPANEPSYVGQERWKLGGAITGFQEYFVLHGLDPQFDRSLGCRRR